MHSISPAASQRAAAQAADREETARHCLQLVRRLHQPAGSIGADRVCVECGQVWPCRTSRATRGQV